MNQEQVRALFDYDPATGSLIWRYREGAPKQWNVRYAGKIAGYRDSDGYVSVVVHRKPTKAHRLVWVWNNGPIPEGLQIDHINRVKTDNTLQNLRLATYSQNGRNKNTAARGLPRGVHFNTRLCKFHAQIKLDRKVYYLGVFDTAEEASARYQAAAAQMHGEFACLS